MGPASKYIGLMTGTSLDGIDAALVRFDGNTPHCLAAHTEPYPSDLRDALLELSQPEADVATMMELDVRLGRLYATEVKRLLSRARISAEQVVAIGSHGQTIRHVPASKYPSTLQIGDPNIVAQLTGITTVTDFRRRDVAAGGQGAPLVPAFHDAVFRQPGENRVILNIGGIANVTVLPGEKELPVGGFDTGPGNILMDGWAARHLGLPQDQDGGWAASGRVDPQLLKEMLSDPFFRQPPPRSTGREHFNQRWLEARQPAGKLPPEDVAATLCELTATTIADAIRHQAGDTERIIVCGGGVHNATLMNRLEQLLAPCTVESSARHGVDPDRVEAIAFAWLARQTLTGGAGNLPSVTGAREPAVLGAIYPGTGKHQPG
ncbi:MAG TPA: anhydro-N-acetylmuramic acid kinase [Gammaproteobacteria bacterium]|nr:anhydro-N-acetylmuramic acid kinase [Gammaproteobacteria bacterium]